MLSHSTLSEALEAHLHRSLAVTHIEAEGRERAVPLEELRARALGILGHLQRRGLGPGAELIVWLGNNEQLLDAFWACVLGGIVPVPLALGINDDHRLKVLRVSAKLGAPFLYTDQRSLRRLGSFAAAQGLEDAFEALGNRAVLVEDLEEISQPGEPHRAAPSDIAFVQFSSGSTSEPKGVVLTHRNLLVNIGAIVAGSGMSERDSFLSWMPLTHDMGLIGFHLTPLVLGVPQFLMPTDLFVRRPLLWLIKASEKGASILCSPNFGYKHFLRAFSAGGASKLDLSGVRLIFNGAEPISPELCRQFTTALAPSGLSPDAMYPVYGLAEASLAVTFPALGMDVRGVSVSRRSLGVGDRVQEADAEEPDAASFVMVGHPIRGCEVRITGDDGMPFGERVVGHIRIRGENVTGGYYRDPARTATVRSSDGWLDTGDLGFVLAGELVVTGRAKDILFVNGQNFFPHDLEIVAAAADKLEIGKVAACGVRPEGAATDEVLIFVVFRGSVPDFVPTAREVRTLVNEAAGVEVAHVIPVPRIPKTTSGKIQRYLLGEQYLRGEYAAVLAQLERALDAGHGLVSAGPTEVERALLEICDAVLGGKKVGLNDNLFEVGTSSLLLAQIYERMEKVFPGRVDIQDLFEYPTLAQLAAHLEAGRGS